MSLIIAALMANAAAPSAALPPTQTDPCAAFDSQARHEGNPRLIKAADLVALADIGKSDPHPTESPGIKKQPTIFRPLETLLSFAVITKVSIIVSVNIWYPTNSRWATLYSPAESWQQQFLSIP